VSDIHLDYSVLNTLQEVMEGEYPTLLEIFLKDSEQRVSQLRQALSTASVDLQAPDLQELSLMAHSFKGSSGNMGALRLAELCEQLEERSRREERLGLDELISKIDTEYGTVRSLFDAERELYRPRP
jgi:HPt (histidine-containing phosphotransfer) domain-containing protein